MVNGYAWYTPNHVPEKYPLTTNNWKTALKGHINSAQCEALGNRATPRRRAESLNE